MTFGTLISSICEPLQHPRQRDSRELLLSCVSCHCHPNANSFSTAVPPVATGVRTIAHTTLCTQSRQSSSSSPPPLSLLFMGGYYAEPQEDATSVNQHARMHMMFGINCFERILVWQSKGDDDDDCGGGRTITYLEPVEDNTHDHNDEQSAYSNKQLAEHIVNRQFDLSNCRTIVELGASVVSLAAARMQRQEQQPLASPPTSSSVVAYDFDEIRLRILQYADRYLNPPPTNDAGSPTVPIQTIHLQIPSFGFDDDHASLLELPETTDLVIVSTTMNLLLDNHSANHKANQNTVATQQEQQVQMLQQLLLHATERSIPIVYTTSANPSFP